ncbi:UDP-N-acetylmuramoyl-tripeptide--D-alanyl-D-alanine ligase [Legionella jordanis]|uniref:UDP-N-acetylmuramoyl-tripeptide--D-alanyl-D-alanine ligase n=1 Tax=Legionella jordanis TaxID=456 RepID=A0A0W0VDK5_9GAMM|nr:UDP-N-acetylmuramoyl-tripeptide--D-alanyl-D-alanine ligase [Legionella jordanis]KTD18203.1 UDP-N-acetylmuramoyl-tripeptide--D-alanyl-D- alani ne ligase [Legionella jordanis]RMX01163.1 UDP-N-acetylmuramoyl-tripeptide--D-alanyl-D-alanine ligase [Legionella jordanis]RMX21393.1 UDP-N-acetylmuramoyl-tripeptide--D-alanyl-D-alanine ligase [Legionella jordanis]VEH13704.1 UDP-N-acetylmuramoyl-tripeptide--D-alanyl-D-alanine ligase [Legionella jordanis]
MNLNQIAKLLDTDCSKNDSISGVCIDSRKVQPGNLFIALKGERFDGHDFMEEAASKGAIAIVCSQAKNNITIPQFEVAEPIQALAIIAKKHRQGIHCPIIALTGSNGKTTVKEMIASILPKPSHATPGNLNNHIGAPLSVLQLNSEHRYAVFELGANHIGEIAYTSAIVQPEVALINNIAPAHIGEFGSIDGVARAKGEIYQSLSTDGIAVVNDDDDYAHFWDGSLINKKVLRFSLNKPRDVYAYNVSFNENGCASFTLVLPSGEANLILQVPGEHSIRNALAAASCCYAVGIPLADIVEGLSRFHGVPGRMTFLMGKNHSLVIDDTYNANLRSVLTAVAVLSKRPGRRILVLGDMGELGDWTKEHHEEVGHAALRQGIDMLFTCGHHSEHSSKTFGSSAKHYKNQEELAQDLLNKLDKNTTVLVKGSRSAAMEKIVRQLVG